MASTDKTDIAVIKVQVTNINDKVGEINRKLDADYVTKDQFDPVKRLVYGLFTLILTGLVAGFMYILFGNHTIPLTTP